MKRREVWRLKKIYWGHVPFIRFLVAAMLGVGLAYWIVPSVPVHRLLAVSCWLIAFAGLYRRWFGFMFLSWLVLICWKKAWDTDPAINQQHFSRHEADFLIGYLIEEPQIGEKHVRGMLVVTGGIDSLAEFVDFQKMSGLVQLTIERAPDSEESGKESRINQWTYGTRLIVPADYRPVSPPRNPGEMDYAAHLAKNNCWHQAYLQERSIRLLKGRDGNPLKMYAFELRQQMVKKFSRFVQNKEALAVASTLILGYRADLSRELIETYSATGTIHVLSVSGMHVVIVFWLLSKLLFWMDLNRTLKRLRFPLLLLAVWGYAMLTGFSPSVLRAAMMLSFVLWAAASGRTARTYNSIGASAFFLILYDPKILLNVGFQLSYLAVIGIVFLYPMLRVLVDPGTRWLRPVSDYSAMSMAAQAGAFPLAMYYFHQFPVYFLIANLIIVLPASLIMYLGFALLLVPDADGLLQILPVFLGKLLSGLIITMNAALAWIQGLPVASLTGIETSFWQCVLIYGVMLVFVFSLIRRSGRYLLSAMFLLTMLFGWSTLDSWKKWHQKKVVIHNLRSRLAISVTGRGETVLYTDLPGRSHGALQFGVIPYLRTFGSLDRLKFVEPDDMFRGRHVHIENGLVQIGNQRLFVYEGGTSIDQGSGLMPGLPVDVLFIRRNPRRPLKDILTMFPPREVVVDASNYSATITRLQEEMAEYELPHYILKDNFAYVWVLDNEAGKVMGSDNKQKN